MTKEQLIQLFQEKDRMRKRGLYELFRAEIEMKASLPFIAKLINDELGMENLIVKINLSKIKVENLHDLLLIRLSRYEVRNQVI